MKILGLIFQQPRFNSKLNNDTNWYAEQAKVIKEQIEQLRKKIRRIRPMWSQMDQTTQRILTQTYV